MRVLDDEQLVRPLQQLVDGCAHRPLDDVHEVDRIDRRFRTDEQGSAPSLIVGGQGNELEDALDVVLAEACVEQALMGRVGARRHAATVACAAQASAP